MPLITRRCVETSAMIRESGAMIWRLFERAESGSRLLIQFVSPQSCGAVRSRHELGYVPIKVTPDGCGRVAGGVIPCATLRDLASGYPRHLPAQVSQTQIRGQMCHASTTQGDTRGIDWYPPHLPSEQRVHRGRSDPPLRTSIHEGTSSLVWSEAGDRPGVIHAAAHSASQSGAVPSNG